MPSKNLLQPNESLEHDKLSQNPEQNAGMEAVSSAMHEVAESASEVLESADTPRESAERVSDNIIYAGQRKNHYDAKTALKIERQIEHMSEQRLRRRIRGEYEKEIKQLKREAWVAQLPFAKFSESKFNEVIARIRELERKIADLINLAIESLRVIYREMVFGK